eukprot:scaffold467445_cov34-Prasinocladus_malaysianus.AAC.1
MESALWRQLTANCSRQTTVINTINADLWASAVAAYMTSGNACLVYGKHIIAVSALTVRPTSHHSIKMSGSFDVVFWVYNTIYIVIFVLHSGDT